MGQRFHARSQIHSVAIDVAIAPDHLAQMNADAQAVAFARLAAFAVCGDLLLQGDGAMHRFERAQELDQESIAEGLDLFGVKPRKNASHTASLMLQQLEGE